MLGLMDRYIFKKCASAIVNHFQVSFSPLSMSGYDSTLASGIIIKLLKSVREISFLRIKKELHREHWFHLWYGSIDKIECCFPPIVIERIKAFTMKRAAHGYVSILLFFCCQNKWKLHVALNGSIVIIDPIIRLMLQSFQRQAQMR